MISTSTLAQTDKNAVSNAIHTMVKNSQENIQIQIKFETTDEEAFKAFSWSLSKQGLNYLVSKSEVRDSKGTISVKWALELQKPIPATDENAEATGKLVNSLQESAADKKGSFSWTISATSKSIKR
ncbi:hypothetical protein [Undibacterium sp. TJN19]|uniref:hypothetical protein n=1 Tax=Undibacterium sp. TJN19 TaxID=3413055 RepID=UPI003BF5904A